MLAMLSRLFKNPYLRLAMQKWVFKEVVRVVHHLFIISLLKKWAMVLNAKEDLIRIMSV